MEEFIEEKIISLEKFSKIFYTEKYFNGFFDKGKPRVGAWNKIAIKFTKKNFSKPKKLKIK